MPNSNTCSIPRLNVCNPCEELTIGVLSFKYPLFASPTFKMIKEEPIDDVDPLYKNEPEDELLASYDIVLVNNPKYKVMSISGLSDVTDVSDQCDISIRTDLKEMKFSSKFNNTLSVCNTKETNLILNRKSYAVKLSRETGHAYFTPIASIHSVSFLDETNKSNKAIDSQNMIYEDCFKMPHPSRNKHDQLCIEMKNYLYKPLKCIIQPELIRHVLNDLFSVSTKRQSHIIEVDNKKELNVRAKDSIDIMNCSHWNMNRINLSDIKQIDAIELQVEALLRKAQILTFTEIQEMLDVEAAKLLNLLPTIALFVLGNWVIKSNLLFKINPFHDTETKQNHYKDLISARDFLLWNVASRKRLTFAEIYSKFTNSPDHEDILNRLTIRKGLNEPIRFKLEEDEHFLRIYASHIATLHKNTVRILERHKNYLET